jgi:type IV secretory pathway VirB2 component (pilin)
MHRRHYYTTEGYLREAGRWIMICVAAYVVCGMFSTCAYAVGGIFCGTITNVMNSGLARAIATIGVLTVGFAATLGRVQWTTAITVSIGIAGVYSAASLVLAFSGGQQSGCFGT